jgi:hypothetical protein
VIKFRKCVRGQIRGTWIKVVADGLLALLLTFAFVAGNSSEAWASGPSIPTLSLSARPTPQHSHAVTLSAKIALPHAASPDGLQVTFSLHVQEFAGAPLLTIGSRTTNAAGVASLTYQPTWPGRQRLVASVTDAAGNAVAPVATTTFVATNPVTSSTSTLEAVRPDGMIGRVVVVVLLVMLALVWITLTSVVIRVNVDPAKDKLRAPILSPDNP